MPKSSRQPLLEELLSAIDRGNAKRVLDELRPLSEGERKRLAPKIRSHQRSLAPANGSLNDEHVSPQRIAAATAVIGTSTARAISRLLSRDGDARGVEPALAVEALRPRDREVTEVLLDLLLGFDPWSQPWPMIRALVREGLVARPDDPRYVVAMTSRLGVGWDVDAVYRELRDDSALLDDEVWRIFEVDVVSELFWATAYERTPAGKGSMARGQSRWQYAFLRLAHDGRLDRARLLHASLAALGRDFRGSYIGWHGELHEALEPTRAERL